MNVAHPQTHQDIGAAGSRVTLGKRRDIVGGNLKALGDLDGSFVDAGERDVPVIGCPPVAGVPVHFFLSDEFGHAVLDWTAAVIRERLSLAFRDVIYMKILVANEGDVAAGR